MALFVVKCDCSDSLGCIVWICKSCGPLQRVVSEEVVYEMYSIRSEVATMQLKS